MVCRPHPRGSELYAQRELDDARSPRGNNLSELAVLLLALRIEKGEAVDCVELGVVECVIEFRTELHRTTVAPQRKFFHQRNVEVGLPGAVNGIDRCIAVVTLRRTPEGVHVKPAVEAAAALGRVADEHGAYAIAAAGDVGAIDGADADTLRQPARKGRDAGNLPVVEQRLDKRVGRESAGL